MPLSSARVEKASVSFWSTLRTSTSWHLALSKRFSMRVISSIVLMVESSSSHSSATSAAKSLSLALIIWSSARAFIRVRGVLRSWAMSSVTSWSSVRSFWVLSVMWLNVATSFSISLIPLSLSRRIEKFPRAISSAMSPIWRILREILLLKMTATRNSSGTKRTNTRRKSSIRCRRFSSISEVLCATTRKFPS